MKKNVLLGITALVMVSSSFADQASANLNMSAEVIGVCTVGDAVLDFGNYLATDTATKTGTTQVAVKCSNTLDIDIGIRIRDNLSMSSSASQTDVLNYTVTWLPQNGEPHSTSSRYDSIRIIGTSQTQNLTVYGEIPPGQYITPGLYIDNLAILSLGF